MTSNDPSGEKKNIWEDYEPVRAPRKETGFLSNALILLFFGALGGLGGGILGYLSPVFIARRPYGRHDPYLLDRVLKQTEGTATLRWVIGGALGALITVVAIVRLWRSFGKAKQ
jgi:hypothetical protein